jgi:predicted helicase
MRKAKIYYARMDEFWRKEEKLRHLEKLGYIGNVDWQEIKPDKSNTWLTEDSEIGFEYYCLLEIGMPRLLQKPIRKLYLSYLAWV